MQENEVFNGQRVWVSILPKRDPSNPLRAAGTVEPIALVPGIVIDANVRDRNVPGRIQPIQRAVEVISFHRLPSGREFYRKQGQGLLGMQPRDLFAPVIDGETDAPITRDWLNHLMAEAANSQESIVTPASADVMAAAIAEFGVAPAPTEKAPVKVAEQQAAFPTN